MFTVVLTGLSFFANAQKRGTCSPLNIADLLGLQSLKPMKIKKYIETAPLAIYDPQQHFHPTNRRFSREIIDLRTPKEPATVDLMNMSVPAYLLTVGNKKALIQ